MSRASAKLAREGKIRELPRMGEKQEQKLLKAIEDYRRIAGRFLLDAAEREAEKIIEHLRDYPGSGESNSRRFAAPRTRNGRRPRHPGYGQGLLR